MSGSRSIAIGRDAVGNVLVTGDGNQIYILPDTVEQSTDVIRRIESGTTSLAELKEARLVDKPLVFVSYIREFAEWVGALARRVHELRTVELWLDTYQVAPGDEWIDRIADALTKADGCLVCIGDRAPSFWQTKEIHQSLIVQEGKPGFKIVPIVMPGGSSRNVPAFLKGYQIFDFSSESDFEEGVKKIVKTFTTVPAQCSHDRKAAVEAMIVEFCELKSRAKINEKVVIETESKLTNLWFSEALKKHMRE